MREVMGGGRGEGGYLIRGGCKGNTNEIRVLKNVISTAKDGEGARHMPMEEGNSDFPSHSGGKGKGKGGGRATGVTAPLVLSWGSLPGPYEVLMGGRGRWTRKDTPSGQNPDIFGDTNVCAGRVLAPRRARGVC